MATLRADVVVVGGGFIGSVVTLMLRQKGIPVILVEAESQFGSTLNSSLGVVWPSPNDPATRAEVAHGHDAAMKLHSFSEAGRDVFQDFFEKTKLKLTRVPSYRIALEDYEATELNVAVDHNFHIKRSTPTNVFEEPHALAFDASACATHLRELLSKSGATLVPNCLVSRIVEDEKSVKVVAVNGDVFETEIAVLATNQSSGVLLPHLKDVFVPMTDVACQYTFSLERERHEVFAFRNGNGHIAAKLELKGTTGTLVISGPRFLLPGAGAGLDLVSDGYNPKMLLPKLAGFHTQKVFPKLDFLLTAKEISALSSFRPTGEFLKVDCHPCDELPLLGEAGRMGKLLVAAGWLANGFASGSLAAEILVGFIELGRHQKYENMLSPQRFAR